MKNFIFLSLVVLAITACNSKNDKTESVTPIETQRTETTAVDTTSVKEPVAELYACPMHPEIQGKTTDECSKCGMALTELVK